MKRKGKESTGENITYHLYHLKIYYFNAGLRASHHFISFSNQPYKKQTNQIYE